MRNQDQSPKTPLADKSQIHSKVQEAMQVLHEKTGMSPEESSAAMAEASMPAGARDLSHGDITNIKFDNIAGLAMSHFTQEAAIENINPKEAATYSVFNTVTA